MNKNSVLTLLPLTAWGVAAFLASTVPSMIPVVEAVQSPAHPECREEMQELPAAPLLTDKELIEGYFTTSDIYTNKVSQWPTNP